METLRCPTCVALLPDPEARRCPLCHTKLRKKRRGGGAIVLGESSRLSGRSLPSEVEFHVSRAEERILPDEKRFDEIVHDPANLPHAPAPAAPATAATSQTVEAVLAFAPTEPPVASPVEPPVEVSAPATDLTAEAEPEPVLDLTAEPVAEHAVDSTDETVDERVSDSSDSRPKSAWQSDSRPKSAWQSVPARSASPLDGSLNDMVGELHRKAREDTENHGSR